MRALTLKKSFTRFCVVFGLVSLTGALMLVSPGSITQAHAQSSDSNASLMARQQVRLNTIEDNLKQVQGALETEFRALRLKIEEIAATAQEDGGRHATAIKSLKAQMGELSDDLDIFNQRLRRSIELSSDVEFRVMRLEKRMQTLLSLSGDALNDAILQEDVQAGGTTPAVSLSRDNDTGGATWSVEKDDALVAELAKVAPDNQSDAVSEQPDNASLAANQADNGTALALQDSTNVQPANQDEAVTQNSSATDEVAEAGAQSDSNAQSAQDLLDDVTSVSVLPDASAEEQYRFAFGSMLQNDLQTAEAGFAEFRELHPDHARSADALYWLGRVQFIQADYGKSAMSFTQFNAEFPDDSRLPEAILMIAESVLNFATAEQACQIFVDLPQMLAQPSDTFVKRLAELKTAANCAE